MSHARRDRYAIDEVDSIGGGGRGTAPGKRTLTCNLPVQRRAASGPDAAVSPLVASVASTPASRRPTDDPFGLHLVGASPSAVHDLAGAGIAGASEALPHLAPIQAAFGHHDVSGVAAHVGGEAAVASEHLGAEAYATGSHVAFRRAPDLHTAAHEAAHVVQQRGGVHLKGGVGQVGDEHEQHADAVADGVVAGRSVESLLDGYGPREANDHDGPVQRKILRAGGTLPHRVEDSARNDVKKAMGVDPETELSPEAEAAFLDCFKDEKERFTVDDVAKKLLALTSTGASASTSTSTAALPRLDEENNALRPTLQERGLVAQCRVTGADPTLRAIAENTYLKAMRRLLDNAQADRTVKWIIGPLLDNPEFQLTVVPSDSLTQGINMLSGQAGPAWVRAVSGMNPATALETANDPVHLFWLIDRAVPVMSRLILHELTHVLQMSETGQPGLPYDGDGNRGATVRQTNDAARELRGIADVEHKQSTSKLLNQEQLEDFKRISAKYTDRSDEAHSELLSHVIEVRDGWGGNEQADKLLEHYLPTCHEVLNLVLSSYRDGGMPRPEAEAVESLGVVTEKDGKYYQDGVEVVFDL